MNRIFHFNIILFMSFLGTPSADCPAMFTLRRKGSYLMISRTVLKHNHSLNRGSYRNHPVVKRLTEDEEVAVMNLLDFHIPTHYLVKAIFDKFGKNITAMDANNLRLRMISPCNSESINQFSSVLQPRTVYLVRWFWSP